MSAQLQLLDSGSKDLKRLSNGCRSWELLFGMKNSANSATGKRDAHKQEDGCRFIGTRRVTSDALLAGGREVVIEHAGREYRLRLTSNGKLILTA